MTTPRALARLAALRGFAWSDEVDPTPDGQCPVLAPNGAELGRLDVSAVASGIGDGADEAAGYKLFDDIVPLSDDERTSLFEDIEDAELAALQWILSDADFEMVDLVAEHFEAPSSIVSGWISDPMSQLLLASRRSRVELLRDLCAKFATAERQLPQPAVASLEALGELRARVFGDSIRLAATIARLHRRHLSFESALLVACRGLVVAIDRFEPSRGTKFSTYGVWWIRQHVTRERMNRGNELRIPVHVSDKLSVFFGRERELWRERGARPSLEDVLAGLEPSRKAGHVHFEQMRSVFRAHLGLDNSAFLPLAEGITDTSVLPPFEAGDTATWVAAALEEVEAALSNIKATQAAKMAEILWGRLGVGRTHPKTLKELGSRSGVSRERIRQLQNKALGKLKIEGPATGANPWDWSGSE